MVISRNFNRFYHSLLNELVKSTNKLKIPGIGIYYFSTLESLKMFLKIANLDYPKNEEGEPTSTKDLSNKELVAHIEFIFKVATENGYTFRVIEEEWQRLING